MNTHIEADSSIITSRKNSQIVRAIKLEMKKYRTKTHLFIVKGGRDIETAINNNYDIDTLFYVHMPHWVTANYAKLSTTTILQVSNKIMSLLSNRPNQLDCVAIVKQKWETLSTLNIASNHFWIALYAPKKPDNVGAVIRVAEATGASGVILVGNFCDPYSPESIRASTGAIFSISLINSEIQDLLAWSYAQNINLIATGLENGINYRQANYSQATVLLMGTEYDGLPTAIQKQCQQIITIPMRGQTNSLNLSVASGILLYEISNNKNQQ